MPTSASTQPERTESAAEYRRQLQQEESVGSAEHVLHRAHVEDRQIRVEPVDFLLRGRSERFRRASRPQVQDALRAIVLCDRHEEVRAGIFEDELVLAGARHADDFEPALAGSLHAEALADRILAGPEPRRHELVDDRDWSRAFVVSPVNARPRAIGTFIVRK